MNDTIMKRTNMNDKEKRRYHSVNGAWPEGTNDGRDLKPTPQEAISAAKRLYRLAMKRPFRGKVELTSGNRQTWMRCGVLYVNPDEQDRWRGGGGWHELVHSMSHLCARKLHPNAKPHDPQHVFLEKEMCCLKRFGGGGRNDAPGGIWEHLSDQLDRLAHHIGKACSKTRVFKRPNRSFERCEVFWCHAINASKCWRSAIPRASTTGAALDRIEIPPDVVGRISQILTPGSSLIVSDYGLSRETSTDIDFIVVMP
jgi:hypothetical protein